MIGASDVASVWVRSAGLHVWQSGLFFLVVLGLTSVLKTGSARVRHALWLLVVVRMLLPVSIELPGGGWSHTPGGRTLTAVLDPSAWFQPSEGPTGGALTAHRATQGLPDHAPSPSPGAVSLAFAWALTSAALFYRFVRRTSRVRVMARTAAPAPAAWSRAAGEIAASLGLHRVGIGLVEDLPSPAAVGLLRPVVLVPTHLVAVLGVTERDAVLLHELIHIKRHDLAAQMLAVLASILYPFHPAVWIASRRLARERELAVDEAVLDSKGVDAMSYAKTLVDVAEAAPTPRLNTRYLAHLSGAGMDLAERVRAVCNGTTPAVRRWPLAAAGAAFLMTLLPTVPATAAGDGEIARFIDEQCERAKITLPTSTTGVPIEAGGVRALVFIDGPEAWPRLEMRSTAVTEGGFAPGNAFPRVDTPEAKETLARPAIVLSGDGETVEILLDDVVVESAEAIGAALKAREFSGPVIASVKASPMTPLRHIAATITAIRSAREGLGIVFEGVPFDNERSAKIAETLAPLAAEGVGDVVLVLNQNTTWRQNAEVLYACASYRVATTTLAVRGPRGDLRKVCQYLPADDGVLDEMEDFEEVEEMDGDAMIDEYFGGDEVVEEDGSSGGLPH